MNTANTQKGKGFIITTSKTQTSLFIYGNSVIFCFLGNKKPVLITKSSIKSNESLKNKCH